jgi:iron complex outermembrane recepter protein
VTLNGFYNSINNYIYQRNLDGETREQNGTFYPVYRYVQGNSLLRGFELFADIHPRDNIHFENGFSYVYGQNEDTHTPLPFIPAGHSKHTLRWVFHSNRLLKDPYVSAGVDFVLAQNRYDLFETRTAGYTLLNFSLGTDMMIGKTKATLFIRGNNVTNKRYYDHLNRLKYNGIYNPGRDIAMGFILPFEWNAGK